ncbi:DUF4038 domain-containing protein [Streptomyces arenae]|uniref:apiosidase-like domain-containing protein n=1 Tax=Streptomyces arenae TaxID=29301 RepID=UPI00265A34BD|nr:DUF4038 domain-containing protein [Streptomyces arenae]MCG7209625.1 DUF4038 domain-containing protein [Streptomyces arenae]
MNTDVSAARWQQTELSFTAEHTYANPYTDVETWAEFTHDPTGTVLRRPAFWDGGQTWRIRFASPLSEGRWHWRTHSNTGDPGLTGHTGELRVAPAEETEHRFKRHGFWHMSPAGRSLVHADGTPALLIADTAWALPWRATEDHVRTYAADRAAKGFNAVLLMSVQPDMHARGPQDRTADTGFDVAFDDLKDGRLRELRPAYFQYLDKLLNILADHAIVPVLQPVFQGFGWKGRSVAGTVVPPHEYARYCRYLVARYGARPVIYLVGADGSGEEPQIVAGGEEIEAWDAYSQPCGIHYRPHGHNRAHQDAPWLDFQWCQTGHRGEHVPERVADMWRNEPVKAVANGEPTYEHSGETGKGSGWWQGHEAWSNLCAGGTMGVVYGAGSMWQWRLHADEPDHEPFFLAPGCGWREALDFEGSRYVGLLGGILDGLPITDMRPDWQLSLAPRGLTTDPHVLYISYGEHGGPLRLHPATASVVPRAYRIVDPRTGETVAKGTRGDDDLIIPDEGGAPRVYICYDG